MYNSVSISLLREAGLSEKEAKLYLAGLELGETTIQRLAEDAGIKRPTAYDIMRDLEKRGLFSMSIRNKKRLLLAEDPTIVLGLLKAREQAFVKALPELKLLLGIAGRKPQVKFYEGVEGLKAMYWSTLESKGTILVYGSVTDMWEAMPKDFIKEYVKERIKKEIHVRGIVPNTPDAQEYVRRDSEELRQLLLIPRERFIFSNEINIYNNKVAIFSFPEKIGVVIESKKIAETQRSIFELAWLGAIRGT